MVNKALKGPLRKLTHLSKETHEHPSPLLRAFAASAGANCAICRTSVPRGTESGVAWTSLHHLIAKSWWEPRTVRGKKRYHESRTYANREWYMDYPENLVVLCLDCHSALGTASNFRPDAGRAGLYRQLQGFKKLVSAWTGERRANAYLVFPRHMHGINGDSFCSEVRERVAAWEHLNQRSFFEREARDD